MVLRNPIQQELLNGLLLMELSGSLTRNMLPLCDKKTKANVIGFNFLRNKMFTLNKKSCYGLNEIKDNSIHAVVTDPPYGINLEEWDKLPDKQIWSDCFRVMKPGAFLLCFSSIKFQHIFTQQLIDAGFIFKDVMLWTYLNGRVPPQDISQKIDKQLGIEREVIGEYNYIQGSPNSNKKDSYSKKVQKTKSSEASSAWDGFGMGLKTAYEPIIMVQKPLEGNVAENILKYRTGSVNIDATRIPYDSGEDKVGHNPHPLGRIMANIIQTEDFGEYQKFFNIGRTPSNQLDFNKLQNQVMKMLSQEELQEYQKFYLVSKVRDGKKTGNTHPTVKPISLMNCLNQLVGLKDETILDPFCGSGSTGVSALSLGMKFIGYEFIEAHQAIAEKRLQDADK